MARAFVDLVDLGYDAQTLPLYRVLHEILGVVSVLDDTHEAKFLADWLSDAEVRQKEVRAAETRNAERMREQLGLDDLGRPGERDEGALHPTVGCVPQKALSREDVRLA